MRAAVASLHMLVTRPGELAVRYFAGRGNAFLPAWSLFTITAAAAALVTQGFSVEGSILQYFAIDAWFGAAEFEMRPTRAGKDVVTWVLLLIAVPLYTVLLRIVFRIRTLPEYLIIAFHLQTFAMVCLAVEGLGLRLAASTGTTAFAAPVFILLVPVIFVCHLFVAVRRVHVSLDGIEALWRTAACVFLYGISSAGIGVAVRAVMDLS